MDQLLYGAAYYDEYMPEDRLDRDIEMMKAAGMNVVRIAESTWSTCEPQPGRFDFSHVTRVLDAMETAGIFVIIGTPTYAIPSWMEKMHPEVMAVQKTGRHLYGARQCMDITNPTYLFYAERVIRKLMEAVSGYRCVIGFQLDNETKYYDTSGNGVQRAFVKYLKDKFSRQKPPAGAGKRWMGRQLSEDEALERVNEAFGLDYWSNRVNAWEDFPDVRGTINGSLAAEFDRFRRGLVTDFLCWQAEIVRQYMREDQFITHNFDYGWKDWSYGLQPLVDHFQLAEGLSKAGREGNDQAGAGAGEKCGQEGAGAREECSLGKGPVGQTVTGCDIYHPSQDDLTGAEIAFGGDLNRSLLGKNYLVLETEAQGYPWWTPYPGQLRLQAYSHLASGADMVEYWHWHSIHNSFETYWKGVLSHDFAENAVYREASRVGREWKQIGAHLIHLKKENKAAILVSNESLTALDSFKIDAISGCSGETGYNEILRWVYDAFYQLNLECDFLSPDAIARGEKDLSAYKLLAVPALYSAPQEVLDGINRFARQGGVVIETFKSAFTDEHVKVWTDVQPHTLREGAGVLYHEFAFPKGTGLKGRLAEEVLSDPACPSAPEELLQADLFLELLEPEEGTEVLLSYDHAAWGSYAAATRNRYGKGVVYYLGTKISSDLLKGLIRHAAEDASIRLPHMQWPLILRQGRNQEGKQVSYLLNYSGERQDLVWEGEAGLPLLPAWTAAEGPRRVLQRGDRVCLEPWDLQILEEEAALL